MSSQWSLRLSDIGCTYLSAFTCLVVFAVRQGMNLHPLLSGRSHSGDTRAVLGSFLRVSEGEMLWDTSPHSNNLTSRSLSRRRSCIMPPHPYPNKHLCLWLFPIHSFQSHLSLPSCFSTPTVLHTHESLSSTCHNMRLAILSSPCHHSFLQASSEKEALFRLLPLGTN